MEQNGIAIKALTLVTFLVMITVNALANILPINGMDTGQISDSYPNLFAPTGLTFSIWGLIYLLLAGFTLYILGGFRNGERLKTGTLSSIAVIFSVSSVANAAWIFAWHYQLIALSLVFMVVILISLIAINQQTQNTYMSSREKLLIRLPFSVYFGWITVATIANVTTLLVDWNWNGFGLAESTWMVIIVLVGMLIGTTVMWKHRDVAYGLVLLWAYLGILIKHLSDAGFAAQYGLVVGAVILCMVIFIIAEVLVLRQSEVRTA